MKNNRTFSIFYFQASCWLLLLLTPNSAAQTILNQPSSGAGDVKFTGVVSIDRLDNIFLVDRNNNIHKFDAAGKFAATYSPSTTGHVALIEAWNTAKILLFYDDQQKIVLLDRFLIPITTARLSDYTDGLVKIATFSSDNKIWAFNESNFSLHKLDLQFPEASRTMPLDLMLNKQQHDIRFMREYQNQSYLIDYHSGIYVFDNLGNYQKKLPFTGLSCLGFQGDELYFLAAGKLHFFHLYTFKERTLDLPASPYLQVLTGENKLYLISDSGLEVKPVK